MNKIKSLDDLKKIRDKHKDNIDIRVTAEDENRTVVGVSMSTCGIAAGSRDILLTLLEEVHNKGIKNVSVVAIGCSGNCPVEPIVEIRPPHKAPVTKYGNVDKELAIDIIKRHIGEGIVIEDALLKEGGN